MSFQGLKVSRRSLEGQTKSFSLIVIQGSLFNRNQVFLNGLLTRSDVHFKTGSGTESLES